MQIDWLGHASVRIVTEGVTLYIDPYQIESTQKADIILITHGHYDHLSLDDIRKVIGEDTVVVSPPANDAPGQRLYMQAGDRITVRGIEIQAVAAYNIDKKFHPRSDGGVGYVVSAEGEHIYHAGDTDLIDEMAGITPTIALLPVSGTYVMTADEAAEAARRLSPKRVIPIHYGAGVAGTVADAERLAALLAPTDISVEIPEKVI
jgi:L-ascorbate metabolism protein UlaG (beta-lactamase superfamily)